MTCLLFQKRTIFAFSRISGRSILLRVMKIECLKLESDFTGLRSVWISIRAFTSDVIEKNMEKRAGIEKMVNSKLIIEYFSVILMKQWPLDMCNYIIFLRHGLESRGSTDEKCYTEQWHLIWFFVAYGLWMAWDEVTEYSCFSIFKSICWSEIITPPSMQEFCPNPNFSQ